VETAAGGVDCLVVGVVQEMTGLREQSGGLLRLQGWLSQLLSPCYPYAPAKKVTHVCAAASKPCSV
jgi:hypothetical protein